MRSFATLLLVVVACATQGERAPDEATTASAGEVPRAQLTPPAATARAQSLALPPRAPLATQPALAPAAASLANLTTNRQRFGAGNTRAFVGRVVARSVETRALPDAMGWGTEPQIATRLTIAVADHLCGSADIQAVDVWHMGGLDASGRGVRTSDLPRLPEVGDTQLYWATAIGGEYFLLSGRHVFHARDNSEFENSGGARITAAAVREVCR